MKTALYLDPPSHHFLGDRLFDIGGAGHGGDQLLAPYVYLREFMNARGIPVHTADLLPEQADGVLNLYASFGRLSGYRALAGRKDVVLSAFFAMECPTVEPGIYRELNLAQQSFKRIFSWSDSESLKPFVGGALRCLPLCWPQSFDGVHQEIWSGRNRKFLALINGNKLPRFRSPCRELYSERIRAIEYFAKTGEIDLYGIGWDGPTFKVGTSRIPGVVQRAAHTFRTHWQRRFPPEYLVSARKVYRGSTPSKAKTLGQYSFAICFENSVLKGWITEKIFDCFFAGTVPVYLGAPDIQDYIPTECFVDMRNFQDYTELKRYLQGLRTSEIDGYKQAAKDFLASARFRPFTKQAFAERFAAIVAEDAPSAGH